MSNTAASFNVLASLVPIDGEPVTIVPALTVVNTDDRGPVIAAARLLEHKNVAAAIGLFYAYRSVITGHATVKPGPFVGGHLSADGVRGCITVFDQHVYLGIDRTTPFHASRLGLGLLKTAQNNKEQNKNKSEK